MKKRKKKNREKDEGAYRSGEGGEEPTWCPRGFVTSREVDGGTKNCKNDRWDEHKE